MDLQDAYLPVPIRAKYRQFLRFLYTGALYEFVVRAIGAALRRRGLLIFQDLDDWLVVGRSQEATDAALTVTWRLTAWGSW